MKVGSTWITSAQALARFFEATTPQPADAAAAPPPRTPTQRERAAARDGEALAAAGW